MSVAVLDRTLNLDARDVDVANVAVVELSPRTRMLLHGPIVPMLLLMAWPECPRQAQPPPRALYRRRRSR